MTIDIDAIKARAAAATEGPWIADGNGIHRGIACVGLTYHGNKVPNAEFIAAARADVPALVAEVERLAAIIGNGAA